MALDGNGHGTHAAGRVTIKEFTITRKTDTSASADAAGPNYFIGRLLSADDLARDTAAATGGDTATRRHGGWRGAALTRDIADRHLRCRGRRRGGGGAGKVSWSDSGGITKSAPADADRFPYQVSLRSGIVERDGGLICADESGGITGQHADRALPDLVGAGDGADPEAGICHGTAVLAWARVNGVSPSVNAWATMR